jgi:hypothetical protein
MLLLHECDVLAHAHTLAVLLLSLVSSPLAIIMVLSISSSVSLLEAYKMFGLLHVEMCVCTCTLEAIVDHLCPCNLASPLMEALHKQNIMNSAINVL